MSVLCTFVSTPVPIVKKGSSNSQKHHLQLQNPARLRCTPHYYRRRIPFASASTGTNADAAALAVAVSASRRFRRRDDYDAARRALNGVPASQRKCAEYVTEAAVVRAAEALRGGERNLLDMAQEIFRELQRAQVHAPRAVAAPLRVLRAAVVAGDVNESKVCKLADVMYIHMMQSSMEEPLDTALEALAGVCAAVGADDALVGYLDKASRKRGYKSGPRIRALKLSAHLKAGNVDAAASAAADMEKRGEPAAPESMSALAGAYAAAGRHARAIESLDTACSTQGMHSVARDSTLLCAVLKSCERARDARGARRVYDLLRESDSQPPSYVVRALLGAASAGGDARLFEAVLLDETSGISARYKRSNDDLNRMVAAASRASARSPHARAKEVRRLFDRACEIVRPDLGAYNVFVSALARAGALDKAKHVVFREMPSMYVEPNVVTHNALLHACVVANEPYEALRIWVDLEYEGRPTNQVTYNTLINLAAECGVRELLDSALNRMQHLSSIALDTATVATILKYYRRVRDADAARAVVGMLQRRQRAARIETRTAPTSLPLDPVVYVSLLTILLECGERHAAITLFGLLCVRRVGGARPFNILMQHEGVRARNADRALTILAAMKRLHVAPDATTYTVAIRAAASAQRLQLALRLLSEMQDVGAAAADTYAWTAVMDACGRARRPRIALDLLSQMRRGAAGAPAPDIAAYNAAIYAVGMGALPKAGWRAALGVYGLAKRDTVVTPDEVTYSALASVALKHRHRVREREVLVDIQSALDSKLQRIRAENKRGSRRRPGETPKLARKLKRISWLLNTISNETEQGDKQGET